MRSSLKTGKGCSNKKGQHVQNTAVKTTPWQKYALTRTRGVIKRLPPPLLPSPYKQYPRQQWRKQSLIQQRKAFLGYRRGSRGGGGGGQWCSRRNFGLGHVSCAAALGLGPSNDPRVTRPSALRVLQAPSHLTAPRSRPALDTRFPTPEAPEVLTGLFPRFPPKQNCVAPVTCRLGKRFILGKPRELVSFQPCPHPGVHVHLNSPQHMRHKVYSLERTRG